MDLTMMERVGDRWGKNGRILFDRPKPTVGCSASGRRRIPLKATRGTFGKESAHKLTTHQTHTKKSEINLYNGIIRPVRHRHGNGSQIQLCGRQRNREIEV
jgi:hypothetical protein